MNLVEIKIRDLSWSEVEDHFGRKGKEFEELWENYRRGKVGILTGNTGTFNYKERTIKDYEIIVNESNSRFWVCEICAEIGD